MINGTKQVSALVMAEVYSRQSLHTQSCREKGRQVSGRSCPPPGPSDKFCNEGFLENTFHCLFLMVS